MSQVNQLKYYPPFEEKLNVISHAIGCVLAIVATILMADKAIRYGNHVHVVSYIIYGSSMILMYAASASYHYFKEPALRFRLKIFDHAAIYMMIAGTYTPFTLITLKGYIGWILFSVSWGIALIGITLKVYFVGRFRLISTVAYVLMGWLIVFAIEPLKTNLPADGLWWLIAGGITYTLGAVLYMFHKLKFNHAIFHLFVLGGSVCHFIAVYCYVLVV